MNPFKQAIGQGRRQIGFWQALASPYSAEICAGAGFDWLLIDGEHAPNDLPLILGQLQAVNAYPVEPVVRLPVGDAVLVKQYLDIGARSLLIPMIEDGEEAKAMVRATRYPPHGIRGSDRPSAVPAGGTGRQIICATLPKIFAFCYRSSRSQDWKISMRSPARTGSTVSSWGLLISPRRLAIWAIRVIRTSSPRSRAPSPRYRARARRRAS